MKAEELPAILGKELERRKYFVRMDVLEQTLSLVKIRLYISPDLFVQIIAMTVIEPRISR
jgi:hypothetical protein